MTTPPNLRPQRQPGRSLRPVVLRVARILRYASTKEIAAAAGCTVATARKHLRSLPVGPDATPTAIAAADPDVLRSTTNRWPFPGGYLLIGALDEDIRTRIDTAQRSDIARSLLVRLSHDPEAAVRAAAAFNPRSPTAVVARVAADSDTRARFWALRSPRCPVPALRYHARHPYEGLRTLTASHPCCPPFALALAARDSNPEVRSAAAANPSCPGKPVTAG